MKTNIENIVPPETRKIETKKNPERLVTMQYDDDFLLYQLQYLADYKDWVTVEIATSWSHKAINS